MTKSREKSPAVPPQLNTGVHLRETDGSAAESGTRPRASEPDAVLAAVRQELNQIVVDLGERGLGGTWTAETHPRVHTTRELEAKVTPLSVDLKDKLTHWSGPSAAGRIDLLMHVWHECWELWDRSLVYRTLEAVVRATSPDPGETPHNWEDTARHAVAHAMQLLTADAHVYKEMNLSDPRGLAEAASKSGDEAGEVLRKVRSVLATGAGRQGESAGSGKVIESLHEIADTAGQVASLYGVIAHAARALVLFEDWLAVAPRLGSADPEPAGAGPSGRAARRQALLSSVDEALAHLRTAQKSLAEPVLGECEPWEQLLIEIRNVADPPDGSEPAEVFVPKRASIRYCYPFAIESDQKLSLDKRDELRADLQAALDSGLEHTSAGASGSPVVVRGLKRLEPTEFFAPQDSSSRLYDGIRIELSEIELRHNRSSGRGEGGQSEKCKVWLDVSIMGNHCLCVEPVNELKVALPHVLYRALRAGTPFVVGAEVSVSEPPTGPESAWDSMHVFSRDIILAISQARFWRAKNDDKAPPPVRGNLHEVVVLRTSGPLATQMDDVAAKLDHSLGGRMLTRSIQRAATSAEEWVRYPATPRGGRRDRASAIAAVSEIGLAGDWLTHTGETTIFGIAAAPSWHSDVYMEAGQFASSWSPLLRLWSRRLQHAIDISQKALERADGTPEVGDVQGGKLRSTEGKLRAHLSQIWSEELCATLAHRRFLDQLLEAAGLDRVQHELEAQLGSAERMTDYWNEKARQHRDEEYRSNERERKKRDTRRETLLAVIALFGLFELGTFLTVADATNLFSTAKHHGIWEDYLMLGVFIAGLVAAPFIFLAGRKSSGATRNWRSKDVRP